MGFRGATACQRHSQGVLSVLLAWRVFLGVKYMQTPPPGAPPPPPFQQGPPYPYGPGYPPPPPPGYLLPPPYYWGPAPPPPPMYQWGPSSLNVDPSVLAGLGYLFPIIAIVFFFIEKTNRFVKFHAAQAMLIYISYFALTIIASILIFGAVMLGF